MKKNCTCSKCMPCAYQVPKICENFKKIVDMKLMSDGIVNGIISPRYGAASSDKIGAMPKESLPLNWDKIPCGTKSFAITLLDNDTVPILGFTWIHWLVCNIPCHTTRLRANASRECSLGLTQGVTSYANGYPLDLKDIAGFQVPRQEAFFYGGMVPVNFAHKYTIKIYALDTMLCLKNGFLYNELLDAMEGHILGEGVLYGIYNAKITYL